MKHTFTLIALLAVLLSITFLSQGCLKDNEEDLFPDKNTTTCDTLYLNCTDSSCTAFDTLATCLIPGSCDSLIVCDTVSSCDTTSTISYANDIFPTIQSQCYVCHSQLAQQGGIILEGHDKFSAYATLVLTAIRRQPNEPKFMLNGGSPLPDCFKQKLQVWINRGSNNN
jgi:hypothetical protein